MRWIGLMARKCLLVFNRAEIADSTDLEYYVAWSNVLRWLDAILHFPVLLALFALGIPLLWKDRRRLALLIRDVRRFRPVDRGVLHLRAVSVSAGADDDSRRRGWDCEIGRRDS